MIFKSYIVEQNIKMLKNQIVLIYGENLGLINDLKKKLANEVSKNQITKFLQDDLVKKPELLYNEINNTSLFNDKKYLFIESVNDKIYKIIEKIESNLGTNRIFLFGNNLEKKSKLRSNLEKSKECDVVACYQDNEITIKNLIVNKLRNYSGLNTQNINTIIHFVGLDRVKLNNELDKIKLFFHDKTIEINQLENLLNYKEESDFNLIKDTALKGDKKLTNELLGITFFEIEKIPLYLTIISQRLNRLKEMVTLSTNSNSDNAIEKMRPPIFWKDRPNFLHQAKHWNVEKINKGLKKLYNYEMLLKSKANLNKNILIKKLLVDICVLANV